jgi:hypothetical protein
MVFLPPISLAENTTPVAGVQRVQHAFGGLELLFGGSAAARALTGCGFRLRF